MTVAILCPPFPSFYSPVRRSTSPSPSPCFLNHHHRFLTTEKIPYPLPRLCVAAASLPPPGPDRPPQDNLSPFTGLTSTLAAFHDRIRIFIAVFFWLSLFFWASIWDGRDNDEQDKGSRPRK